MTFNEIIDSSYEQRDKLHEDKIKYFSIIYKGVLEHEPLNVIHRRLFRAIINPNKRLLKYSMVVAKRVKKFDKGPGQYYEGSGLALLANAMMHVMVDDTSADKLINVVVTEEQSKQKDILLSDMFKEGRETGKIFYVASSHEDSAADHKPYQGKLYVDAYYNRHDKELCEFVRKNGIKTVQWVTGKPVWFITRPNCRHYFIQKTFDEVKDGDYHVPHKKIGSKKYQTPADVTVAYYKKRLKLLISLQKVHNTQELQIKITKTKILIKKWEK